MTNEQLAVAITIFLLTTIGGKLIERYMSKKNNTEDSIETDIKESVEKVLAKLTELDGKLGVTNERTQTLFKMVNKHEERIEKLSEEILDIHKKSN